jgi:photosystem II stability/assembly factor-like uncharacterized protein
MYRLLLLALLLTAAHPSWSQFQSVNSGTTRSLWDVWFVNESTGIAVGDSGVIIRSTDGGLAWSTVMTADTITWKKVKFFDAMHGIAIGTHISTTEDGGLNWTTQLRDDEQYYDVEITNDTTCLVSGYPTGLIRSRDSGATWDTLASANLSQAFGMLSFVDDQVGYTCPTGGGATNLLSKTVDGGATWTVIPSQSFQFNSVLEALSFVSENKGFRAGWYNGHLTQTADGGDHWEFAGYADSLLDAQLFDLHVEADQPNAYYACGWHDMIIKSVDGGNTWLRLPSGLPTNEYFYGIYFISDTVGWVVGTHGTILKTVNGGGLTGLAPNEVPLSIRAYPNPMTQSIRLSYPSGLHVREVHLYDQLGQSVFQAKAVETIETSSLPAGRYHLQVLTDQGAQSIQLMKE